jgi:hypothetical protein
MRAIIVSSARRAFAEMRNRSPAVCDFGKPAFERSRTLSAMSTPARNEQSALSASRVRAAQSWWAGS